MMTMDIQLAFAVVFNAYWSLEKKAQGAIRTLMDWIVDASRWAVRERRRRVGRQTGAHRTGKSVWTLLAEKTDEELDFVWKPSGQHRDRRGWRYRPQVWSVLERITDERMWDSYWKANVKTLMEDIRFMLDNPPKVVTYHGCKDCVCGVAYAGLGIQRAGVDA